ncbi:hypothetical protein [Streptomyces sp. BBFR102]|uniref:hypothetical protein n=1 Tax=Streptomyces sp. BBFR102 TaxID=3448171 RepID=UPI003F52D8C1
MKISQDLASRFGGQVGAEVSREGIEAEMLQKPKGFAESGNRGHPPLADKRRGVTVMFHGKHPNGRCFT